MMYPVPEKGSENMRRAVVDDFSTTGDEARPTLKGGNLLRKKGETREVVASSGEAF